MVEPLVVNEALLAKAGLPPPFFKYRKDNWILCPICDAKKTFSVDAVLLHIHHRYAMAVTSMS
jgi:hypothetical protein